MQAVPNLPEPPVKVNSSPLAALRAFVDAFVESQASQSTHKVYRIGCLKFLKWYEKHGQGQPITATTVKRFRAACGQLAPRTLNLYLTIAKVFLQAAAAERIVPWETAVLVRQVRNLPASTVRPGCWLDVEQAKALLAAPDTSTLIGIRDKAIIGVMLGAGLRRSEVTSLRFEHLRHVDGRWVIWRLMGKGRRVRDVPIADWSKQLIDDWAAAAELPNTGPVFRRMWRFDHVLPGPPHGKALHKIVGGYAKSIGLNITPHDLRRTFAMLSLKGGAELRQIQYSLGHGSVAITEKYLLREQNMTDAPADHLGIIEAPPHRQRVVEIATASHQPAASAPAPAQALRRVRP